MSENRLDPALVAEWRELTKYRSTWSVTKAFSAARGRDYRRATKARLGHVFATIGLSGNDPWEQTLMSPPERQRFRDLLAQLPR